MKKLGLTASILSAALLISACAPRLGADHYSIRDAGRVNQTLRGTVITVRPITISSTSVEMDNQPGAGALLGGTVGAVLGSQLGKGRGSILAGLGGALAGGAAGHYAGQALTDQQGFEYQVKLETGGIITLAQGANPSFRVGERVLVIKPDYPHMGRGRIVADLTY